MTASCGVLSAPQARLALASCAMFSEGSCQSAAAQVDRQMVHVATRHERDWQSGGGIPGWSPSAIEERVFSLRRRRRRRLAARLQPGPPRVGHQGAGGPRRASKVPSIKHVRGYECVGGGGGGGGPTSSLSMHMKVCSEAAFDLVAILAGFDRMECFVFCFLVAWSRV